MPWGREASTDRARAGAPDWRSRPLSRDGFRQLVRDCGRELYRSLAWRDTRDPYAVLVSEVMLQQTQVARVQGFWPRWMAAFPTVDALAAADTAVVLEMWQGLGYNRRALALKRACEHCASDFGGQLPRTTGELMSLPGIGPATAAGVVAFAFDEPCSYLETNVRSVFLHELFPGRDGVPDREILPYVADACPPSDVRGWYYALLDYGAHLKKTTANPSRRSSHHVRQGKFEGSRREKRSFLLKQVLASPGGANVEELAAQLDAFEREAGRGSVDRALLEALLDELASEGFFQRMDDSVVA